MTTPDIIANLEAAYAEKLAERAQQWAIRHPEEAKRLREEIAAGFRFTTPPTPDSLVGLAFEAAVVEAIRALKGWPREREWVRLQAGEESPRYMPPKLKTTPVRDVADRQKLASGERE